ncbi:PVC-type heme-binding CxxCH protein [Dyadobacter sp. CY312]|uniref:PVC-type heme-binding CxxCH protein n=1 Tax=Dyadobacter sp. CY312 TaxID=2907303 RepID=UPI001F3FEACC|nr:PVC-type heme-binding CxxCH protein [Dyadobacter sp. CY312]MCE7042164.1 GDSL-type esterase/lipase family protein [Dyadobacter sp. CY312]
MFAQSLSPRFSPKKNDNIIILGNTFADRMRHFGYFETLLQSNYLDLQLTVRNMGWSADEVGLQPRPLNFPGFKREIKKQIEDPKDLSFRSWGTEGGNMPIALNFDGLQQSLSEQSADIIFLCFGMNEAFKGEKGLPQFEKELNVFIKALQSKKYNGKSAPVLVLVSPIAHEKLGGHFPNPDEHNRNLERYTETMRKTAVQQGLSFIDLYAPTKALTQSAPQNPITINGIHLTDKGYRETARMMALQLGFTPKTLAIDLAADGSEKLRSVIKMKDEHFFYRWRAVNGEYIYGRRREPFGIISFPPEMAKLDQMATSLDSVIWDLSKGKGADAYKKAISIIDESGNPAAQEAFLVTKMTGKQSRHLAPAHHGSHVESAQPAGVEQFTLPEGYEANLFASEQDFPLAKPVALAFDARGRLWVATIPTYPQYIPGVPVHDKIVILEDTNGDGKADKHTVFADNLYLPLGFEFGNGGVFVSQEPDILFLKDTNGDDVADVREIVLSGFGSEDSHHATHAFTYGQDGGIYFNEGIFLNTQVETPYGPIRSYNGATYRFEPRTGKLDHYISYPYYNPWGNIFDKWGTHLIGDASDGSNYFAPPMTGKINYPDKHPRINMFTTTRVRPTAGLEIVSSRHFPDDVQGNLLINNAIGFQGIKQHQVLPDKSAITSKEVEPLLQSSDPNFRPVDLEFGPDGALYVVDWYNPLISHGENPPRDPARDKVHGRIWRVSYKNKPLLKIIDISKQTIPQLLDNLKEHEDRLRYRSRVLIREQAPEKLIPELEKWVKGLNKTDKNYEHNLLEALWLYQDFHVVNKQLLTTLLNAKDFRARAAAVRIVRYWKDELPEALAMLSKAVQDTEPRVRIEAITAFSYFESEEAVAAAVSVLEQPTDYYLDFAINETFSFLKPVWLAAFKQNQKFLENDALAASHLLAKLAPNELAALPSTNHVLEAQLDNPAVQRDVKEVALKTLSGKNGKKPVEIIVESIRNREQNNKTAQDLVELLLTRNKTELAESNSSLRNLLKQDHTSLMQSVGYAALIVSDRSDQNVWPIATAKGPSLIAYLEGVSLLNDQQLQSSFYEKVKKLTTTVPDNLAKNSSDSIVQPIHQAAYKVLFQMPGKDAEKANLLAELIKPDGAYLELAQKVIEGKNDAELKENYAPVLSKRILSFSSKAPENKRFAPSYNRTLALGKRLAGLIPSENSKQIIKSLDNASTIEIAISAIPSQMLFDQALLTLPAGRRVSLTFHNPDLMPHNIVFTKPGAEDKVGAAADAMASVSGGFEKNFVPDSPDVLFASPLVNPGQNFRLDFQVPQATGDYPYICSFPGHWRVMRGIMKVTEPVGMK